jgi:hypothetical protein
MNPPIADYYTSLFELPQDADDPGVLEISGADDVAGEDHGTRKRTRKPNGKSRSSKKRSNVESIIPSYEGYLFTVADAFGLGETPSWVRTHKTQVPISSEELFDKAKAHEKNSGLNVSGQFQALSANQQAILNHLIDEKNAAEGDQNAMWTIFGVRKIYEERKTTFKTWRFNNAMRVTIRRGDRKNNGVSDLAKDDITFQDIDKANIVDLRQPVVKKNLTPRIPSEKVGTGHTTGNVILHQAKLAPSHTAGHEDDQEYEDPFQNVKLRNVEGPPEEFADLQQPLFDPLEDIQPLDPLLHGDQQMQARDPSPPRGRRSVDIDEVRARESRKIEDVVRDEVLAAEDKILDRGQTRSRSGSLHSTRSTSPGNFSSTAGSSGDTRFTHSISGTSPDRSERYNADRPTSHFRRRDSSVTRPYVEDRKRYYTERDRNYVVKPHETYREYRPRYPRDRRQEYDDYPYASQRRRSREREYDRPRIQRRVTDYPEAFYDTDFGRPSRSGASYERERRVTDNPEDFDRPSRSGAGYERTRVYEREDRRRYAHEERREGRNRSPLWKLDKHSVATDSVIVASSDQTEGNHSVGEQQNGPDVPASPKTTALAEEMVPSHEDLDQHDLNHAGSTSSPGLIVSPMIDSSAEREPISHASVEDFDSDYAESVFSQASMASSMTSLGGSVAATGTIEMIDRIISTMFFTDGLQRFDFAALKDSGIGSERYRRNIRRMIKTFGMELRTEATSPIEFRAAVAMQTRSVSTHVAREMMVRASGTQPRPDHVTYACEPTNDDQQSDVSIESADEDEDASNEGPEHESEIRSFILDSNACLRFKNSLVEFVHKPYEGRIMSALSSDLPREVRQDKVSLTRTARELSWIPTNLFSFSHDRCLAATDLVKGLIEDSMGESWDWSPLEKRKHRLQANLCRLSWICVSLSEHHLPWIEPS